MPSLASRSDRKDALTDQLTLETSRLILRPWQERHREPFAAMNADPVVMKFFFEPMSRQQSDEAMDRYRATLDRDGFGFLAAELRATGEFAGLIGMQVMRIQIPGLAQPAVEIGWRLCQPAQGQGLATEGARAVLDYAFTHLHLPQVVAITIPINTPSRHVMEKLGMSHRPELSFDHPHVPQGHPYQRHVLYSVANPLQNARQEA
jgi:RimJ/RimL family protein N-acetyltransferase